MIRRLMRVLIGLVALAVAIFGALYWKDNYLSEITLVSLPVAKSDIPPYTVLDKKMFEQRDFPRALTSGDIQYFVDIDELAGKVTTSVLLSGQPISVRLAAASEDFRLADPSLEVASLPISLVNGVGGKIEIGELINIYKLGVRRIPDEIDDLTSADSEEELDTFLADVELIATVPVVAVLADNGDTAFQGDEPRPMSILVVAAPAEIIQEILGAIALSESGEDMLWITLAEPLDGAQ